MPPLLPWLTRAAVRVAVGSTAVMAVLGTPMKCVAQAGDWSQTVAGIRGRLVVAQRDSAGKPQIRIDVELENVGDLIVPMEIWWSDPPLMLDFRLEDEAGTPLMRLVPPRSGPVAFPTWLVLPHASAFRVTVSKAAYEYPSTPSRVWLRPVASQAWDLTNRPPGPLYLRATFTPRPTTDTAHVAGKLTGRALPWVGPLSLPRIRVR